MRGFEVVTGHTRTLTLRGSPGVSHTLFVGEFIFYCSSQSDKQNGLKMALAAITHVQRVWRIWCIGTYGGELAVCPSKWSLIYDRDTHRKKV